METSLKTGFAQIFSCCPKNLSCPKFAGAAAPLAPPGPYAYAHITFRDCRMHIFSDNLSRNSCIHWLYLTNWPEKKCIFCIFICLLSLFRWQRRSQTRFWICQKSAPNNLKRQLSWSNILFTIDFCLRKQLMFIRGTHRGYSLKPLKHSIVERILVFKR